MKMCFLMSEILYGKWCLYDELRQLYMSSGDTYMYIDHFQICIVQILTDGLSFFNISNQLSLPITPQYRYNSQYQLSIQL